MLRLFAVALIAAALASAGSFVNGNFETGDLSGWTQGGGTWDGTWPIDPSLYEPGGANYDPTVIRNSVVTPGPDPIVGSALNRVYSGNYSAQINDSFPDNSISMIFQRVNNYTDPSIFFAWAAVLEASHGPTDSDNFVLSLRDETTGTNLYEVAYNSATAASASLFKQSGNWFYTDWQVQSLDVSAYSGHDFTLSLLASDCPYGGHAGYVYLDGFGSVNPPAGGGSEVPEPSTVAMLAGGLAGIGVLGRRRMRRPAA